MIQAFIFDMDGVIIDSEPLHFSADKMLLQEFGVTITDEELHAYVGTTDRLMWSELKEKYNLQLSLDELLARQKQYKRQVFTGRELQPVKGINELLGDLKKKGIPTGLASSSARDFIELILQKLKIRAYFQAVVSGEEVENSKPAPDIFLQAAKLLNAAPANCVVLEDSEHGVKAAKAAGMKCIAYRNPSSGRQDLSAADKIVTTLENLNYLDLFPTVTKGQTGA